MITSGASEVGTRYTWNGHEMLRTRIRGKYVCLSSTNGRHAGSFINLIDTVMIRPVPVQTF